MSKVHRNNVFIKKYKKMDVKATTTPKVKEELAIASQCIKYCSVQWQQTSRVTTILSSVLTLRWGVLGNRQNGHYCHHTLLSSSALYGDATRQKKKQTWILHKQFFKTKSSHRKKQISRNRHRESAELIFFLSECFLSQCHSGSCFKFSPTQHQHAALSARYCRTQIKFYTHYMAVSFSRSFSTSCSLSPNFSTPSFNILFPSETKDNKYNGRDSDFFFHM